MYKGVSVGEYIPDLITHNQLVVDTKVIERITDHEVGQILNFKQAKLEWKRIVLERSR